MRQTRNACASESRFPPPQLRSLLRLGNFNVCPEIGKQELVTWDRCRGSEAAIAEFSDEETGGGEREKEVDSKYLLFFNLFKEKILRS